MFKKVCAALAVLAVSTLGAAGSAHAQSYKLNQAHPDDPYTILQEISVTPERTTVTILLRNTSKTGEIVEPCAFANTRPEAFTLKDLDSGKVWKQEGATGLKSCDVGRDKIKPGGRKTLKLQFASLPATVRRVQLGENNCQQPEDSDDDFWCFAEVVLTTKK